MTLTTRRSPIVLVDMDGVIADLEAGFWGRMETSSPRAPKRADADPNHFHLSDQLPGRFRTGVRAILDAPGFFASLPPVEGAADALGGMLAAGWDVRICTAPLLSNPTCASDKLAWLETHMGAGWSKRAIIAKDKSYVVGDILIDDKPAVSAGTQARWQHVVFDRPYNADSAAPHRLQNWAAWAEALPKILSVPVPA